MSDNGQEVTTTQDQSTLTANVTPIDARWEDVAEAALARAGFAVIDRAGTNDYEGWGVLLGRSGDEFAVVSWAYGSCPGCDDYEDLSDEARAAEFDGMIARGITEQEARLKFDSSKGW